MVDPNDSNDPKPLRYEPFSEYYLHPSEGIGDVISPILLNGDNYESCSRSIRNNLRAKNKLGFIDGTIVVPNATSPDLPQWGIVNSMLVAWIFNTLHVSVRSTIRFPDNVKSLWHDLRDRYSLGNGPRILELKNKIRDCRQLGRPVAVFFGELLQLQVELLSYRKLPVCTCSAASETFCHASLNVAYAKIISDERKQLLSEIQEPPRADVVGFAAVSKSAPPAGDERVCSHCVRPGHLKEHCFQLYGFSDIRVGRGKGQRGGGRGSAHGAFAANAGTSVRGNSGVQCDGVYVFKPVRVHSFQANKVTKGGFRAPEAATEAPAVSPPPRVPAPAASAAPCTPPAVRQQGDPAPAGLGEQGVPLALEGGSDCSSVVRIGEKCKMK
ncbi:hypothetical protein BVRB_5g106760 [Beta vulgaris subsp. vulgaris]|nr:hypothetical protein BVRB_5g106760 [Beta vulgaris subsp. vulgaris]